MGEPYKELLVAAIGNFIVMIRCRLRWHGHVDRKYYGNYVKALVGGGEDGSYRQAEEDLAGHSADTNILKVDRLEIHDRKKWRTIGRRSVWKLP